MIEIPKDYQLTRLKFSILKIIFKTFGKMSSRKNLKMKKKGCAVMALWNLFVVHHVFGVC